VGAAARWLGQHGKRGSARQRRTVERGVDRPGVARVRAHQHLQDAARTSASRRAIGPARSSVARRAYAAPRRTKPASARGRPRRRIDAMPQALAGTRREPPGHCPGRWRSCRWPARRHRRRRAARAAPGVPGIAREAVQRAVGVPAQRHSGKLVRRSVSRRPRTFVRTSRRNPPAPRLGQRRRTPGRGRPHVDVLLDRERHAVQRPNGASAARPAQRASSSARGTIALSDGFDLADALQVPSTASTQETFLAQCAAQVQRAITSRSSFIVDPRSP